MTRKIQSPNMVDPKIKSPITYKENISRIKKYEVDWIIREWEKQFNYDVSYLFKGFDTIELFRCDDSGYLFFYPEIEGDSKLYEYLQNNSWYYMPWKWEHDIAVKYLKERDNLLEIGSAEGNFLDIIRKKYQINVFGIETNSLAVKKSREKGLTIYEELIQDHSAKNPMKYDVVCIFQVLEHISDVKSFINACLICLQPGGTLIISVPNNLSFISEFDEILSLPPHHAGVWDEYSLQKISSFFKMKFESIFKEPLQDYHKDFFKSIIYRKIFGRVYENKILRKFLKSLILRPLFDKHLDYLSKWVVGHTIVAVYRKIGT